MKCNIPCCKGSGSAARSDLVVQSSTVFHDTSCTQAKGHMSASPSCGRESRFFPGADRSVTATRFEFCFWASEIASRVRNCGVVRFTVLDVSKTTLSPHVALVLKHRRFDASQNGSCIARWPSTLQSNNQGQQWQQQEQQQRQLLNAESISALLAASGFATMGMAAAIAMPCQQSWHNQGLRTSLHSLQQT